MNLPGDMTIFDEYGNFNLLRAMRMGGSIRLSQGKSYPMHIDLKPYSPRFLGGRCPDLLLDKLPINAENLDTLFHLQRECVSFLMADVSEQELERLLIAKSKLFLSTREQAEARGILHLGYTSVQTSYRNEPITVTPLQVTAAFNPAALAILSLPAYLVLDIRTFATAGSRTACYGRLGIYNHQAPAVNPTASHPSESIESLDDYLQAFHFGNFLQNNSDAWLTMYGLAYCLAVLVACIRMLGIPDEHDSMEEICRCAPFNWLYDELVHRGALRDPFDRSQAYWSICQDGIENARETSEGLHAALKLAELLQPFPISTVAPGSVNSIFYGLIDIFNLRRYFGIDMMTRFEYPR